MSSEAEKAEAELVKLVLKNPCLWSKCDKDFKNNEIKETIWSTIGKNFGIRGFQTQGKFRMLRQKYIREKEKIKKYESLNGGKYNKPKWHLVDSLSFLDDVIEPRKSRSCFGLRLVEEPETTTEQPQSSTSTVPINRSAIFLTEDEEISEIFEIKKADPLSLSPTQDCSSVFSTPTSSPTPLVYMPSLTQVSRTINSEPKPATNVKIVPSSVSESNRKRRRDDSVFEKELLEAATSPVPCTSSKSEWGNISNRIKHFSLYLAHRLNSLSDSKLDKVEMEILNIITGAFKSND